MQEAGGIIVFVSLAIAFFSWASKKNVDEIVEKKERELAQLSAAAERKRTSMIQDAERQCAVRVKVLDDREQAIVLLSKQKAVGFPWLANAYAEFYYLKELELADELELKDRPAPVAAERVRESAKRRREAEREARVCRYLVEYYESLFPWLEDLKDEAIDDERIRVQGEDQGRTDSEDKARQWLTPEEYGRLQPREKYQLALDRYSRRKNKSNWEVGREYERYIGHVYEDAGWEVHYQGIVKGYDDLGRDLVLRNGDRFRIAQCKNWSREKTIHEKHIFQLYGTLTAYRLDHPGQDVEGEFITSTTLSDRARRFAEHLGIRVSESKPLVDYPCVKCNVSKRTGEKIYHLPFDQQYDTIKIELDRGECYLWTVAEAEDQGFWRAFRYRGETGNRSGS